MIWVLLPPLKCTEAHATVCMQFLQTEIKTAWSDESRLMKTSEQECVIFFPVPLHLYQTCSQNSCVYWITNQTQYYVFQVFVNYYVWFVYWTAYQILCVSQIQQGFYVACLIFCLPPTSLNSDLIECLSVSGDPTDRPGGAKEYQTVGAPSSLWAWSLDTNQ